MTGFQGLSYLWLAFLFIPLIIFYFLKLKRPRTMIPSLVLWQQVLNDQRVNSPFQRFKRHLLLLLQLLILLLLILAAMQPFYMGNPSSAVRVPIMIDNSASMGAIDEATGKTRLAIVKDKVSELIDNKLKGQQYALIAFGKSARKHCGFTDNARVLHAALDKIEVDDVGSNPEDAFRMVEAMARNFGFEDVLLFSDGNIPEKVSFDLPFKLDFRKVGVEEANVGITGFSAKRSGQQKWAVFVQVQNTKNASPATIQLLADGKLLGEESYVPTSEQGRRLVFEVDGRNALNLEVKMIPEGHDALATDNKAFLFLPKMRPLNVFVASDLKACRAVMNGMEDLNLFPAKGSSSAPADSYDLVVSDKEKDFTAETPTVLFIGVAKELDEIIQVKKEATQVVDWTRSDPLLEYMQLKDLMIFEDPSYKTPDSEKALGSAGFKVVVHGTNGPLLVKRTWTGQVFYDLFFQPQKSNLPYRIAFPIMMTNLVNTAFKEAGLSECSASTTGVLPKIKLQAGKAYTVKSPHGPDFTQKADKYGLLTGIPALSSGIYEICDDDGQVAAAVGVGLMDPRESSLQGISKLQFNELSVEARKQTIKTTKNLWPLLAFLGLIVLVVEWWVFNKPIRRRAA